MRGTALRAVIEGGRREHPKDVLTSVSRALEALEEIAASPQPIPAKALAHRLGISLGTSYHVLHTLEHAGFVVRLGQGRFGLGEKASRLSRRFRDHFDLMPALRPLLAELAERAGEDAYLAVFRGGEVAIVEVVEASRDLHLDGLGVGFSRVAHASALGKVLLAAEPEGDVRGYLDERPLVPLTRRTLVRRRHIRRHLDAVRELGVAKDLEELADGCCCVAVPVPGALGTPAAAIGLSCPAERWRREQGALVELCSEIGARGSAALRGLEGGPAPMGPGSLRP